MSEFKDIVVKMGECEILLAYDSKMNKIDILSNDIGDIVFGDNDNIDSVDSYEERLK